MSVRSNSRSISRLARVRAPRVSCEDTGVDEKQRSAADGPGAPLVAAAHRRAAGVDLRAVVLVEGISDQFALEALAERRGRNLDAEGISVVPIGGAQAMERLGFYVCVADLEDELIRALGAASVEQVVDAQGDLGAFRTLQKQPAWQGRTIEAQLRRFMGSGGSRKIRYARLLIDALDLTQVPRPLELVLAHL